MNIDPFLQLATALFLISCGFYVISRIARNMSLKLSMCLVSILFSVVSFVAFLCSLVPVATAQEVLAPTPPVDDGWLYGAGTMLVGVVAGFLVSQYKSWRERVLHDNREDWRDLAVAFADRLGLGGPAPGVIDLSKPKQPEEGQP